MDALIPGLPHDVAEACLLRVLYDRLYVLYSVCRSWRRLVRSPEFYASRRRAGITRPLLLFHAELINDHQSYLALFDPACSNWRLLDRPTKHIPSSMMSAYETVVGAGRYILVISTWRDFSVRIYNFYTGCWRKGSDMPGPQRRCVASAWDGGSRVYFAGCSDVGVENNFQSALFYDMEKDEWTILPDMPIGGKSVQAAYQAGVFRRVRPSTLAAGGQVRLQIDLFDESSTQLVKWRVEELEGVKYHSMLYMSDFAFGEDGRMYCCQDGKVRVKDDGEAEWRDLVDLPPDVNSRYLTTWKGGLLMAGTVSSGRFSDKQSLRVQSLKMEDDDQTPTWVAQSLPNVKTGLYLWIIGFWVEL